MNRRSGSTGLVQAFVVGLLVAWCAAGAARAEPAPQDGEALQAAAAFPDEIRGTVTFNGCVVPPAKLAIRAVPLGVQTDDGYFFPPGRAAIRKARITATADPHVLAFSIRGLAARAPYQLGVSYPPNPCGKTFWRGPERGLVLTGTRPVRIEGFAAQTQVELLSRETDGFVGADELEFMDAALSPRVIRWRSLIPGVTGGQLQLSTEAFPQEGAVQTCDEPETGIFYRQAVPAAARGRWRTLDPLDFGPLLTPAGRDVEPIPGLTPISAAAHGLLLLGAPVYVRVVPMIGETVLCDARQHGIAGWAVAAKRPKGDYDVPDPGAELPLLAALGNQTYTPPYLGGSGQGHPKLGELAYRLIKQHTFPPLFPYQMTQQQYFSYGIGDPMGMMLLLTNAVKPGEVWTPVAGQPKWIHYFPKSSGDGGNFFSDFLSLGGNLITGTFTAFGEFADYMATLSKELKKSLAAAVVNIASVVPGVSEACGALQASPLNTSCEAIVQAGMEYGLASMGLPPSLPSWQELQDQGIEYLAAEVSTQIGDPGVLESFTEDILHDLVDHTLNQVAAGRPGLGKNMDWLTPYLGFDPAVWKLSVFNTDPTYHPQETYIRVKAGNGLFQEVNVHVPENWPPGGLLHIPVVLRPSKEGILAPLCRMDLFGTVTCEPKWWLQKPRCEWQASDGLGGYDWMSIPCQDWPDIYYRDAWVQQKLLTTQCVFIGGYSASNSGGLWLTNPNPPFTDAAYLPPLLPATWDGPTFISPTCP